MSSKYWAILDHAKSVYASLSMRQREEWNRRAARNWVIGELKLRHRLDEKTATRIAFEAELTLYGEAA